jgi:D-sedoheptulose 7-phosphate isomerase
MHPQIHTLLSKYPELENCADSIEQAYRLLHRTFAHGGKLLVAGNGGSAADCEHIVGELMKGFMSKRRLPEQMRRRLGELFPEDGPAMGERLQGALPAISLVSQTALQTAFANDVDADLVFAQQVYGYAKPEDSLLVLSTSGNSVNVVRAVQVAKAIGISTVGMTGRHGGALHRLCDVTIRVPYTSTPDVQERHLPIYHTLCIMLEEAFFQ